MTALTDKTFDSEINTSTVPVLVDFWASWCGPCMSQTPILESLAKEVGDKAKICKVNVDEQTALASRFGVMSIPTLLVFKEGKMINKAVGLQNQQALKKLLGL